MPSVESAKRKLHFDEPRINRMETERTRAPIWKIGRRLEFGETDPSVLVYCADFLPNQADPDPVTRYSSRADRIIFTTDQKRELEALFRKVKCPVRKEREALAGKLHVPLNKVTTWFSNRRQRWRKEQKKGLVGLSGSRPVLPGSSSVIQSSHQNAVGLSRFVKFPERLEEPSRKFSSKRTIHPYSVNGPLPTASSPIIRPIPVTSAPPAPLPCQQIYPPLPAPARKIQQLYPDNCHQHTTAPWFQTYHSMPVVHPVSKPSEFHPDPHTDLANEFPFSYSIAKELPHIFGNVYEEEVLERPLTPSFESPVEFESICDSLSDSDQSVENSSHSSGNSEDFADYVQSYAYDSCRFGCNKDFSSGFVSKGMNFTFFRRD